MENAKLERLQMICRYAHYVVAIAAIISFLALMIFIAAGVFYLNDSYAADGLTEAQTAFEIVSNITSTVFSTGLIFFLHRLIRSLGYGDSPFRRCNVRDLRLMGLMVLGAFVFTMAVQMVMKYLVGYGGVSVDVSIIPIITFLVLYGISVIFQYGVELQDESDGFL